MSISHYFISQHLFSLKPKLSIHFLFTDVFSDFRHCITYYEYVWLLFNYVNSQTISYIDIMLYAFHPPCLLSLPSLLTWPHLPACYFPRFLTFSFVLWSTEFHQLCRCKGWIWTLHWSPVESAVGTQLKAMTLPLSGEYRVARQWGVGGIV